MRRAALVVGLALLVGCSGAPSATTTDAADAAASDASCNPGCYCPEPGQILCDVRPSG